MTPQTFIFIGRSGCGKGTQVKLLEAYIKERDIEKRSVFHLETGENFRAFIKGSGYTNKLSLAAHEKDVRQPDFLAVWMWSHLLVEKMTGNEHLFIDGAPRSLIEAQTMHTALEFYGRKTTVVFLDVSRSWSEKHLLARGRADDATLGRIDKRLNWFDADVLPAIEFFKNNKKYNFIKVNGEQAIEQVHADIVKSL